LDFRTCCVSGTPSTVVVTQVFLSAFFALWTYYQVIELRGKNRLYDNPFGDGHTIPFTNNAAPLGKSDYSDVVVDGGQFINKEPYPYSTPYQNPQVAYQPPPFPPAAR
jgi:hypothetical protein